jgi:hypothetical protein
VVGDGRPDSRGDGVVGGRREIATLAAGFESLTGVRRAEILMRYEVK